MSKSREQLNSLVRQIDIAGKTVLDVGCQDKLARHLTAGEPAEYHTMDVDDQWKPDYIADLNEDSDRAVFLGGFNKPKWVPKKYDIVFCLEVLEHCWNPVQAVQNLSYATKLGGTVIISTPFINPHHDVWDYLRYTDEWYEKVLPKRGLEIVRIEERKATVGLPHLQAFFATEGLRYSKIRQAKGPYTYPIGYFVEARKQR